MRAVTESRRRADGQLLGRAVAGLHPGYFALVMATGITSVAALHLGWEQVSATLLVVAAGSWIVLAVGYVWRVSAYRRELVADLRAPEVAFAFFTVVAACDVLAARLVIEGYLSWALALAALAAAVWLALSYLIPLRILVGPRAEGVLSSVNGSWFIWIVATQSLSIAIAGLLSLSDSVDEGGSLGAVVFWGVGVVLYVVIVTLVLMRLLALPVYPDELAPHYWVSMGATAITVLAGARLLALDETPALAVATPVITGLSFVLWAFGTWLFPPLVAFTVRQFLRHHARPHYTPVVWSMIFPLGMYAVASIELGRVTGVPELVDIGRWEAYFALAAWVLTFAGMVASIGRAARRRPPPASGARNPSSPTATTHSS